MAVPQISQTLAKRLDLFNDLPDKTLHEILGKAIVTRLTEGEILFKQGDPAENFYVLLQGQMKISQITPSGEQIIVRHVGTGEIFGIAKAVQQTNFPATGIVVQESLILSWPSNYWDTLLIKCPKFAQNVFQTVGQRLQDAHSRIRELSTEEVEQRIARALLRMMHNSGIPTEDGIEIGFPVTRQDIAELTGTTLHTVSRLLSQWKTKGIITSGRRRITVCSVDGLKQLAHDLN